MRSQLVAVALLALVALAAAGNNRLLGLLWKTLDTDGDNKVSKADIARFTQTFHGAAAGDQTVRRPATRPASSRRWVSKHFSGSDAFFRS
jgi:hypothetical protein